MRAQMEAEGTTFRQTTAELESKKKKKRPAGWKKGDTKKDDKSWGMGEWFAELAGGSDAPDTGPKLGGRGNRRGSDEAGNYQGDRRVFNSNKKKTVNDGAKFNPLDASTW